MNSISQITAAIKEKAREIGFDKIGIVAADALVREREMFEKWLEKGFHAEMRWIEREPERRTDPRLIFPEAKSVIALAINYYTPFEHENDAAKGKISRYAWGDDYHDVVGEKLRALLSWITENVPHAHGKTCVDTAPMLDKAWARRAGLGWIGKHSNLISRDFGSWLFLGEIILNIELEYDSEPERDHCGSCTKCLEACPTQAIVAPYEVDARLCLSYATIELRASELPSEIAENMNGWLYGCDICQDVCPWNRFEQPTENKRFEPRLAETSLSLDEVRHFTPESYAARFRKSAIKRAKLGGLQRNAAALAADADKKKQP